MSKTIITGIMAKAGKYIQKVDLYAYACLEKERGYTYQGIDLKEKLESFLKVVGLTE